MTITGSDEVAPKDSQGKPAGRFLGVLRVGGLIAVLAGAVGSLALMLYAGRRNASLLLVMLFAIWVLSPFLALAFASMVSKGWSVLTRAALYSLTLVLTLGSLFTYGDMALGRLRAKTGFIFLIVPLASWLLIAVVLPTAALVSPRLSRRSESV